MAEHRELFLARLQPGAHILDAGCGSGRDARAFLEAGFRITAIDASVELARRASEFIGQPVTVQRFEDLDAVAAYDAIWASASLLHVPREHLPAILDRLWVALRPGGHLYCSFPLAVAPHETVGRLYTTFSAEDLRALLERLPLHGPIELWETSDAIRGRNRRWVNALLKRGPDAWPQLITGGQPDPFLPHLLTAMHKARTVEIAVSFIRAKGLQLLLPDLHEVLNNAGQIRIVTSDYLDITEPEALRHLAILQERGALVRVFEAGSNTSFHMKAYIFSWSEHGAQCGRAFIGSSNISQQALRAGLEWNYRVDYPGDRGFLEARARFSAVYSDFRTVPLTHEWITTYSARQRSPDRSVAPGSDETLPPPVPHQVQVEALDALDRTRRSGYRRGLVVLATGLGKTWLSAFDVEQADAKRVLFVAHREEILVQAAETYQRIRPNAKIGFWKGSRRDAEFDILFASIQTIGREQHLNRFSRDFFDYIVVDEFHHAAASSYRRLLRHVHPRFLLGMTATPSRTDNADILTFCDDNLVYQQTIVDGINRKLLVPFRYYGIVDQNVDYDVIPWRSGRFDPTELSNRLATISRARHSLDVWRTHSLSRTLAFCASRNHADFTADFFRRAGVQAVAAHGTSEVTREDALSGLESGEIAVVFSVDLFTEGIDVPSIDSVMMLRPTESSILFLQQLGRGIRLSEGKQDLVVLDFVANHASFLHKPMALMGRSMTRQELADFAREYEEGALDLPAGCYINFDPEYIDFLKRLTDGTVETDYRRLRDSLGRRPSALEFYRGGGSLRTVRQNHGHWYSFVRREGDLAEDEAQIVERLGEFLKELETTAITKSFKMILLEAFQELDGWQTAPSLAELARASWQVLQRRPELQVDLPLREGEFDFAAADPPQFWYNYWRRNPIAAWIGESSAQRDASSAYFAIDAANPVESIPPYQYERFASRLSIATDETELFAGMVQELIDLRLAQYGDRSGSYLPGNSDVENDSDDNDSAVRRVEVPYFAELAIACGHFRTGSPGVEEYRTVNAHGHHATSQTPLFIAEAHGTSMDAGNNPIRSGDKLLLQLLQRKDDLFASANGEIVAVERSQGDGTHAYLLRIVVEDGRGGFLLRANHPDYEDIAVNKDLTDRIRTVARLIRVVDPLEFRIGEPFLREDTPPLFGEEFNPGNWNSGHVTLHGGTTHVLLVTLDKRGRAQDHRYVDHWIDVDKTRFHWQSQRNSTPTDKKGREIINHQQEGRAIHLFVRDQKLQDGKAAPFVYHGRVRYITHRGSKPMNVEFELDA